jgi:hypothetical protein
MLRYIYWATLLIIHIWWWSLSWVQICVIISFKHLSPLFTLHLHYQFHQSLLPFCYVMSTNNCFIDNLYWISFFNHFFSFILILFLYFLFPFISYLYVFFVTFGCLCACVMHLLFFFLKSKHLHYTPTHKSHLF